MQIFNSHLNNGEANCDVPAAAEQLMFCVLLC